MNGWALPILFVPGKQVICSHADGLWTHPWAWMDTGDGRIAMVMCVAAGRMYVHEGQRGLFEAWARQHPAQAVALARTTDEMAASMMQERPKTKDEAIRSMMTGLGT